MIKSSPKNKPQVEQIDFSGEGITVKQEGNTFSAVVDEEKYIPKETLQDIVKEIEGMKINIDAEEKLRGEHNPEQFHEWQGFNTGLRAAAELVARKLQGEV